ncbi:MAG: hydrogenase iron-sulfur subunit [Actinomycetota bacterium]|jgi:quinone-modifying oxidoreductase subunit QmoB|nr:hydrogenase iron-sulfur subunit [Actinomycetota bacterium]
MSAEKRAGVYLCHGCGIGDSVDVDALAATARSTGGVTVTRTSRAFCLEDAELIASDIEAQALDAVVVAACSPRVNRQVFGFGAVKVERVNLREQVAWSHPPREEATEELAADLLRMGIAACGYASAPTPHTQAHQRSVVVVGAGPAGLEAAVAAADAGYAVTVVEREPEAGGFLRRIHRCWPSRPNVDTSLENPHLDELVERAVSHPNVTLRTSTTVEALVGEPGHFVASLQSASGATEVVAGSVVLATGSEPLASEHFAAYGLGTLPDVITSSEMEELARQGEIRRPSDGRVASRVAILACDGPSDDANLPYTGTVASMVALKQAVYVHDSQPDAEVFLVYEDMQTPGFDELYYRFVQRQRGVYLVRGHVSSVDQGEDGHLGVVARDSVLARDVRFDVDLVVLDIGMVPTSAPSLSEPVNLHLKYLQGEAMPLERSGFVDSNFLCFPFETRRTGIYAAGAVHRSQDVAASRRDGAAAALKAVQVVEKASTGEAVHPRVGELGYPQFFMQKCTACGRCTQECPFGALELDEARHPVINPNRCRRCGICMGACPVQVISFPDYSVEMVSAMQKAVELPEDDSKPRVLVLACENDAYPAIDMMGINRLQYPAHLRVLPVRCLGSVNAITVTDAIQRGFDGVALLGCRSGEDYQCHFIQGSELLGTRMDNVRETLGRLALEEDRVQVLETSIADARRLPDLLAGFAAGVAELGPNPMKGF